VSNEDTTVTPYELFGGQEFFTNLVAAFYRRVAIDDILRPMYPGDDLEGAEWRLRAFLEQYWGGPGTYSEERGHPRLRMRHAGFAIDTAARNRWVQLMAEALEEQNLAPEPKKILWQYLVSAAISMQNVPDEDADRESIALDPIQ
jgi:hemoglobin